MDLREIGLGGVDWIRLAQLSCDNLLKEKKLKLKIGKFNTK
jgi:hypothetical protein